jgi:hypothetical protein
MNEFRSHAEMVAENQRLRVLLDQIASDLERELEVGGQMPTVFPGEIREALGQKTAHETAHGGPNAR